MLPDRGIDSFAEVVVARFPSHQCIGLSFIVWPPFQCFPRFSFPDLLLFCFPHVIRQRAQWYCPLQWRWYGNGKWSPYFNTRRSLSFLMALKPLLKLLIKRTSKHVNILPSLYFVMVEHHVLTLLWCTTSTEMMSMKWGCPWTPMMVFQC